MSNRIAFLILHTRDEGFKFSHMLLISYLGFCKNLFTSRIILKRQMVRETLIPSLQRCKSHKKGLHDYHGTTLSDYEKMSLLHTERIYVSLLMFFVFRRTTNGNTRLDHCIIIISHRITQYSIAFP